MWEKIKIQVHNLTKKHWLIYTVIITLPTIWFSIVLNYFGLGLGFIGVDEKNNKYLTSDGLFWTVTVVLLVFGINLFNNYYASKTEMNQLELLQNENSFYRQLNESVDYICNNKYERLKQVNPVIAPESQLKCILEQINKCLCIFISQPTETYSFRDFEVTLAYNFPEFGDKWFWLEGTNERDMSIDELIAPSINSTFNYLINSSKPYYFNNSKEDAKRNLQYVYNSQDEMNSENEYDVGSIFCYKFQLKKNNKVYINSVLSITTSQKRFSPGNEKRKVTIVRENIVKLVKENFAVRIGIELITLYLHKTEYQSIINKEAM